MHDSRAVTYALAFCALFILILHVGMGAKLSGPWQAADEIGFLANARYLSGVSNMPNMGKAAFYPFGYSVLLVPAFWLSSNQLVVYHAALTINALLWTAQFFALYALLTRAFDVKRASACAISFVVALFPAYLLHSNICWAENAFPLFVTLSLLALHALLRTGALWSGLLFGSLSAYLYAIHGRGILAPVVAIAFLAFLCWRRRIGVVVAAASAASAILVFALAKVMEGVLLREGYALQQSGYDNQVSSGIASGLAFFARAPLYFLWQLVQGWAGALWYLVVATYGLAGVGIVAMLRACVDVVWSPRDAPPVPDAALVMSYAVLLCGAIFAISFGLPANTEPVARLDHLFYGRYNEGFLFLPLAFGMLSFVDPSQSRRTRASNAAFAVVLAVASLVIMMIWAGEAAWSKYNYLPTVWGVAAWFLAPLPISVAPVLATLVAIASLMAFALFMRVRGFVYVYCGTLFILFAAAGFFGFIARDTGLPSRQAAESIVDSIPKGVTQVSYNFDEYNLYTFFMMQYWLRDQRYELYSPSAGQKPPFPVVISQSPPPAERGAYTPYRIANFGSMLWVPATMATAQRAQPGATPIVMASPSNGQNPPDKAFDRKNDGWADAWISEVIGPANARPWIEWVPPKAVSCGEYAIAAANHLPVRYPSSWTVTGTTEKGEVKTLGTVSGQTFAKGESRSFKCEGGDQRFSRLRFEFDAVEKGQDRVAVGEITIK